MAAGAELLTRQFTKEIKDVLFPSNTFLSRALNDDAFVNNNTVELAHSGTIPAVQTNRVILPAPIAKRTDVPTNYELEELTTDPTLIQDSEALTVAYDKRRSVLMQHAKSINTKAANKALYAWAGGAANFVPTTGGSRASNTGAGQTGNRKKVTKADYLQMKALFHSDDVVSDNSEVMGISILTPAQYTDILGIDDFVHADKFGRGGLLSGVVGRILGFDVYIRSSVIALDGADALKAEGAAGAATDQDAALFYSADYVRRAKGSNKIYIDNDKPEYYGGIFSVMQRFGASPARNDNKGVYVLFEDTI